MHPLILYLKISEEWIKSITGTYYYYNLQCCDLFRRSSSGNWPFVLVTWEVTRNTMKCRPSSVASHICQERQSERTFPILVFSSRFFPCFPDFSRFPPLFPDFWQVFRCQGWHSAPPLPPPPWLRHWLCRSRCEISWNKVLPSCSVIVVQFSPS